MAGIPKLPGYTFSDPTFQNYNLPQTFNICKGYKIARNNFSGVGGRPLTRDSIKFQESKEVARFDPSLTYGRTKTEISPPFRPHYVLYSQKNLTFQAFFKQGITESPNEYYRVRKVRIIYFLEDDTITVFEPKIRNSGIDQGRVVRRGKIPKNERGEYWHWKDFNVGIDIALNGIVYHIVDCDKFTREYMASQGLTMNETEAMPDDPYTFDRQFKVRQYVTKTPSDADKLRRFLEYDGKVLRFNAVWDDRENEYGDLMKYEIMYFLSDDTVSVKNVRLKNDGRDPYCMLLRRMKLPKNYDDTPSTYPAIYFEMSDAEVTEYYQPIDFQIGETIFILGRDMLLYDCDQFTRDYFIKALGITQKEALNIEEPKKPGPPKETPPHDGLGSLEDSIMNTLSFIPKPPRKNIAMKLLNHNKFLRYEMMMETVHPEDTIRRFVMLYSLADGTCKILEPPIRNSGILGGTYLRPEMLIKPGSDRLNPDYYSPRDFYIGATISVFKQRFKIVGADLYVYRYMIANNHKFPPEVIENMRNYMFNKGYLDNDIDDQVKENIENEKRWDDPCDEKEKQDMDECYGAVNVQSDPEGEKRMRDKIYAEYQETMKHKSSVQPFGPRPPLDVVCPNEIYVEEPWNGVCREDEEGQYASYTPKHVDTPEEVTAKYYAGVLKTQQEVCDDSKQIECVTAPPLEIEREQAGPPKPEPLMVTKPEIPPGSCKVKKVTFADELEDRCKKDRYDLCKLKGEVSHADCTDYERDCIMPDQ